MTMAHAATNGHTPATSKCEPVCLIHGGHDGLRVTDEGIRLLESLREPIAVVCLAGQYRTGKSFFLNQLARHQATSSASLGAGFRVGPTTESCTRGIWLWDPQPTVRNARGERVLFMDTEGIAATDNDESYDAKIFSLGLLLSSLFVFNTMGVIDEGAIDRLYLVSELTKHVCVSTDTSGAGATASSAGASDPESEWKDAMAESRALAPHFPPFIWLLRDFMLDMQADGASLSPNEYLEKSLELRDGSSRRNEDRNRIRQSIQVLFAKRECLTLVRPVMDELQLRRAADLNEDDLRPEFVTQMHHVRERILQVVSPKLLFGKVMDGTKLAHLAKCYTDTLNSGSIPDIKAAWAYVSEATCQTAMLNAIEVYDKFMAPAEYPDNGDESPEDEDESVEIMTQQDFEKLHKDAQDEALNVFKNQSVEGSTRAACFQKVKNHIQKQKTLLIAGLQKKSTRVCEKVLKSLKKELLSEPLSAGAWDSTFFDKTEEVATVFGETMNKLESMYESKAQGPAKKTTFFTFLREDMVQFHEDLFRRLAERSAKHKREWEKQLETLQNAKQSMESQLNQQIHDKEMEIQRLLDAKAHAEEKDRMQQQRIQELTISSEQQQTTITNLEAKHQQTVATLETTQREKTAVELELEKTKLTVEHTQNSLAQREHELQEAKVEWASEVGTLRSSHETQKEEWIQKLADQTAERSAAQKTLKQREHELQQKATAMEIAKREYDQLVKEYESEQATRRQREQECSDLRELVVQAEKRLEETVAKHLVIQDEAERAYQRLEGRLHRYETQLGRVESDKEVEDVLRDCVMEVVRLAEVDKANVLQEERNVLQERLGELYIKISTLPEFYQREIFCSPDPEPSFFDVLTQ